MPHDPELTPWEMSDEGFHHWKHESPEYTGDIQDIWEMQNPNHHKADDFIENVSATAEASLSTITGKQDVEGKPIVALTAVTVLGTYTEPTHQLASTTIIPGCVEFLTPNECGEFMPFGLPGTEGKSNMFFPALGTMVIAAGRKVLMQAAMYGLTEIVQWLKLKYNVPGLQIKFRTGEQPSQKQSPTASHGTYTFMNNWATNADWMSV